MAKTAAWRDQAACIGQDLALFFPVTTNGLAGQLGEAKRLCRSCPVREACLNWAISTGTDYGVFGGLDERERRAVRLATARRRRRLARPA